MIRKMMLLLIIASVAVAPAIAQEATIKIYETKYKSAEDIARLLVGFDKTSEIELVSGSINAAFKTFTVRATPAGHARVADIIRKYDVPNKTIEFQFFLIKANTTSEGLKDGVPDKVQKALKDVASLTRYKGFELIDAPFIRIIEGSRESMLDGRGIYSYDLRISAPKIATEENKSQISINSFGIRFNIPAINSEGKTIVRTITLSTSFNIIEGEIVVLGASQIERESKDPGAAIITIVTAKIL
jgi:hypothetical protein